MRLVILDDYDQLSEWAAKYVRNRILKFNPGPENYFVLGLPTGNKVVNTVKALLSSQGAYLISGPKRGGFMREGGLIEREGGAYFKSHIFDEIHNNFIYFTIIPITKTEQENVFLSPFYKYNVICTLT